MTTSCGTHAAVSNYCIITAGFIAVIVVLSFVVLVACTAVFILLRRNITDAERLARRQRRYQPTSSSSHSEFDYNQSSQPNASSKGLFSGISRLFTRNPSSNSTLPQYIRTRNGSGWQQADSGDEWDVSEYPSIQQSTQVSNHPASIAPHGLRSAGAPAAISRNTTTQASQANLPFIETKQTDDDRVASPEPMSGISPTTTNAYTPGNSTDSSKGARNSSGTKFIEQL